MGTEPLPFLGFASRPRLACGASTSPVRMRRGRVGLGGVGRLVSIGTTGAVRTSEGLRHFPDGGAASRASAWSFLAER